MHSFCNNWLIFLEFYKSKFHDLNGIKKGGVIHRNVYRADFHCFKDVNQINHHLYIVNEEFWNLAMIMWGFLNSIFKKQESFKHLQQRIPASFAFSVLLEGVILYGAMEKHCNNLFIFCVNKWKLSTKLGLLEDAHLVSSISEVSLDSLLGLPLTSECLYKKLQTA